MTSTRSTPASWWRALRQYWAWWAVPMLVLLALTLALAWLGRGDDVLPIHYGHASDGR